MTVITVCDGSKRKVQGRVSLIDKKDEDGRPTRRGFLEHEQFRWVVATPLLSPVCQTKTKSKRQECMSLCFYFELEKKRALTVPEE